MKLTKKRLLVLVIIIIGGILLSQLLWEFNMYGVYKHKLTFSLDDALTTAVKTELAERMNDNGEPYFIKYSPAVLVKNDSNAFYRRMIVTEDTTYSIHIKRDEQDIEQRIFQLILKQQSPINVERLNELFKENLTNRGFDIVHSTIEYIDLEADTLLAQSSRQKQSLWKTIAMDTVPIDITGSIGVRAVVVLSPGFFLKRMFFQSFISLLLLVFASVFTVYLYKTILQQRKVQKMHQDFVNSMVHEFKRPITNAATMLEIAPSYLAKNQIERAVDYVTGSLRDLMVLANYTNKIQRFNNSEKETIQLDLEPLMLSPFLKRLAVSHESNASKIVHIDSVNNSSMDSIFVDRLHFSNVMDNLIENAIKYSDEAVHITLIVSDEENCITLTVMDDGDGITDSEKKRIFEAFYRGDSVTKRKRVGFGLGLSYVKAVVQAHNGKIWIEDAPMKGSKFIIQLPV